MKLTSLAPFIAWLVAPLAAVAAAPAEDEAPSETSELQAVINSSADWFELAGGPDGGPLKAVPVLRWDNASRGSAAGLTVLYVGGGRPEAVCCVYPFDGNLVHDFESLSRGPLTARRGTARLWEPDDPGVTFAAIPDAGAPAESRPARLRQMKSLTDRFRATLRGWEANNADRQDLRLMPRPLYRYEETTGDLIDGAVFSYATGTDPEVLLLIKAVRTDGGSRWEYAFARRTAGESEGLLDDAVVWKVPKFPEHRDPGGLHRCILTPLAEVLKSEPKPAPRD